MKSVFTLSASLAISLLLCCTAQANNHKILGVIAMPRNETNDLALKLPVCRIVGNDSNLLIVFYVQIMPDDFVMQLHRF